MPTDMPPPAEIEAPHHKTIDDATSPRLLKIDATIILWRPRTDDEAVPVIAPVTVSLSQNLFFLSGHGRQPAAFFHVKLFIIKHVFSSPIRVFESQGDAGNIHNAQ